MRIPTKTPMKIPARITQRKSQRKTAKKTINQINAKASCTVLYTINKEAEEIGVHSKKNMLFVRQIPGLKDYLVSVLNDFYNIRRDVLIEIEKCKVTAEQQ